MISDGSSPANTPNAGKPRRQIRLTGPSRPVDPTQYGVRRDLADIELADSVFAQHYVRPLLRRVVRDVVVHRDPTAQSAAVGHVGADAMFAVLDIGRDWAWGKCASAGCIGYVPADALA